MGKLEARNREEGKERGRGGGQRNVWRIFKPLINESTSDGLVWWMEINRDPISKWPKRAVKTVSRENLREQPIREQFHSLQ